MASLSSLTTKQQVVILALLAVNVLVVCGAAVSLAVMSLQPPESFESASATAAPTPGRLAMSGEPSPTSTHALIKPTVTRTNAPPPTSTPVRASTSSPTATGKATVRTTPAPRPLSSSRLISPSALARLELDPRALVASKTSVFTSACFGESANLLQDHDYMAPADWAASPDRKCVFGFAAEPGAGMPTGRYSVFPGPDGLPRFYIVPPEAFAQDLQRLKQLSELHLIVDHDQGCDALGFLGVTADGVNYQCSACAFLRRGGVCPGPGGKSIVLPTSAAFALDVEETGGAYGFQGYPLVLFRKGFSLYFTGKAGGPPPRVYFESAVDTLLPSVNAKSTAEMSGQEIRTIASTFDGTAARGDLIREVTALEQDAKVVSYSPAHVRSKEKTILAFEAAPGSVLSSISWRIKPLNNVSSPGYLETNMCLEMNGQEFCFTGVEDFAHCAFYEACKTGFSSLVHTGSGEYIATRYWLPGASPILRDGRVSCKFQGPDIGTVLEMEVKVRVRPGDATLAPQN